MLAATLALGAFAFAPAPLDGDVSEEGEATAEADTEGAGPELYGPCSSTSGATVLTPDVGFDEVVPTPLGAANLSDPTDAALLQLSLEGLPVGTTARVDFTLDWDTPLVGDYDLNINGQNDFSVDQPERETSSAAHCSFFDVKTEVFLGTPVDTLTLTVDAIAFVPVTPVAVTS